MKRRRRRSHLGDESSSDKAEGDSEIEELPDRFDASGRPLDPADPRGWSSRSGSFVSRPRHRARDGGDGDWNISGSWGVGGTDPEIVDGIARTIGDVIEGRKSWFGVLGDVLLKGSLPGLDVDGDGDAGSSSGGDRQARRQAAIDYEDEGDGDREAGRSRKKGKARRRRPLHRRDDEDSY